MPQILPQSMLKIISGGNDFLDDFKHNNPVLLLNASQHGFMHALNQLLTFDYLGHQPASLMLKSIVSSALINAGSGFLLGTIIGLATTVNYRSQLQSTIF